MSIMSSLLPFLLLCLFILHACKARHLGVIHNDSAGQAHLSSSKEAEKARKNKTWVSSEFKPYRSRELRAGQQNLTVGHGRNKADENGDVGSSQRPKDQKVLLNKVRGRRTRKTTTSGVAENSSLGSVSWRVPHEKQKKHPGFDQDYAPPKTHPPTHN
ncbi:PREDICTED: uncharacterized protein LOC104598549 [Nelumbo nucifera]|uniref:Uncharacterized protein LOC104598549 n=2 Tax=Nelumbo nucifera TaxID=4432 RepID=A0A1U8A2G9_NELNU|nr:PREDICTED: uncharacterized protein LOC104598549 [Nelumbo nucifera]DAD47816.1 TPA_asm: hypothetical protein HUJ06_017753 [Nelumbo nucifera]